MAPPYFIPPAGVSAAGLALPNAFDAARPPIALADDIDPETGDLRSLFSLPSPVVAAVLFNVSLVAGSGAATGRRGSKFLEIRQADGDEEFKLRSEVARVFAPIVASGAASLDAVAFASGEELGDRSSAGLVATFTDRLTGIQQGLGL